MQLGVLEYYLIGINILGFVLFAINTWLYSHTENKQIDIVLTIIALAGASLGIFLSILIIDRKAVKGNMMSRVFVICVLVIQIIAYLMIKGVHREDITLAFWKFFGEHRILVIYLLVINIVAIIIYGIDKINAIEHRLRFRIVTLLAIAFAGGSIGALIAMRVFRHKTQKDYFSVGVPLILIMQIVLIFYIMNVR